MFTGNKRNAINSIGSMISDILMKSFQIDWSLESNQKNKAELVGLSLLVTETMLLNMEDTGCNLPFYCGKPSREDIDKGIECVRNFYEKRGFGGVVTKRKIQIFRKELECKLKELFKHWEQERKKFFKKG